MGTKLSLHTAALYDRGGMRKIGELLDLSRIKWERVRDEVSHATVWIEAPTIECGKVLGLAAAGRHELVIFRNDDRVWEGPITRIAYTKNGVEIEARDITHYLNRTIIRSGYDNTYPATEPVLDRLNTIMQAELARKEALDPPINVLPHLMLFKTADDARTAAKTQPYEMTLYEHLETYAARGGIDYVVVGRSLILFDYDTPLGQTAMVTDSDFLNDPIITEYGMELATYSAITDGFGNYGATPDVVDPYYGEWEILDTAYDETVQAGLENPNITVAEMQSQATRVLAGRNPTPVVVRVPDNSTLNPCGNLTISDLVPGVWVPLTAELPGRTLTQMQKLDSMRVEETDRGEQIKVVLGPNNGESGEIIVWDGEIIINPDYVWDDELGEWVIVPDSGELIEVYLGGVKIDPMWWEHWSPSPIPDGWVWDPVLRRWVPPAECPNLVENPEPRPGNVTWDIFEGSGENFPEYKWAPITGTGWSCTVDVPEAVLDLRLYNADVPIGSTSTFWAEIISGASKANFTIYAADLGTGGTPVLPETNYTLTCRSAVGWWGTLPNATLGMKWYDAAGSFLSEETGQPTTFVEYPEGEGTWVDRFADYYLSEAGFCEAAPVSMLTSPAGAAFGRPFVVIASTSVTLDQVYVANFSVQETACANLIPNPEPTSLTGWSSSWGGTESLDDQTWPATSPSETSFLVDYWDGPGGAGRVYPTFGGTEGVPIAAGETYSLGVSVLTSPGSRPAESVAVGVVWYNSAGVEISSTTGPALSVSVVVEETGWVDNAGVMTSELVAHPGAMFIAPAGAAFARPFVSFVFDVNGPYIWVGMFTMVQV